MGTATRTLGMGQVETAICEIHSVKPIEQAIADLDLMIMALPSPAENTPEWFKLRALVAGRSMLKAMAQKELDQEPARAESYYRGCRKQFVMYEEPE